MSAKIVLKDALVVSTWSRMRSSQFLHFCSLFQIALEQTHETKRTRKKINADQCGVTLFQQIVRLTKIFFPIDCAFQHRYRLFQLSHPHITFFQNFKKHKTTKKLVVSHANPKCLFKYGAATSSAACWMRDSSSMQS